MKRRGLSVLLLALLLVLLLACGTVEARAEVNPGESSCEHNWSNGICTKCNAVCSHANRECNGDTQKNTEFIDNGDGSMHTCTFDQYELYVCTVCGDVEEQFIREVSYTENHFWNSDGTCALCRAACPHQYEETGSGSALISCVQIDAMLHLDTVEYYKEWTCSICGHIDKRVSREESTDNNHVWSDGVCEECGYTCQHPTIEQDGDPIRTDGEAEYVDAGVHIQHYTTEQKMKCSICSSSVESTFGSGKDDSVEHTYVGGVCVCGAIEPKSQGGTSGTGTLDDVPQTGDNSNMILWIVLLLASGFGVTGAVVYSKRKKYAK